MVSGANRGIGAAIAARLAADGCRLSLGARRPDALAEHAPEVEPERILLNYHEAADVESARRWVEATVERFGRIDVLVNSAGIVDRTGLESMDEDVLDEMWAVNVKGPLRLTRLALPHLRRSGTGRVINMASLSAKRVKGDALPGYSMTKYALLALSHAIRQVGWDDGVRVTALCPGPVATDMMDPERRDHHPAHRRGRPGGHPHRTAQHRISVGVADHLPAGGLGLDDPDEIDVVDPNMW